ncbi:metal-dependent transcriptional regulator [Halorussus salinisoli]|uniref:metal-dependent transcriptional regulator n=1 Tax=Halorussus salinisoli TaxID=2558242 RepID=UPI0010C1CF30|nr:metal-dependent transcriptional regulator [Halorussus salinisoli]
MGRHDREASNCSESATSLTPTMEDYLRHIYRLQRETDEWVANSTVADRLGVSNSTVTSMFEALAERNLIEREKYRPVRLTDEGRTAALHIVRRHRLAETMLFEIFGYGISEVDSEADVLEHHLSDRLCREVERILDAPETDPHGDPIPDVNLAVSEDDGTRSLAEVSESSRVEVVRILTQDDEVLDHLVSNGIEPSAVLVLDETTPFGMVNVTVADADRRTSLPETIATKVLVDTVAEM